MADDVCPVAAALAYVRTLARVSGALLSEGMGLAPSMVALKPSSSPLATKKTVSSALSHCVLDVVAGVADVKAWVVHRLPGQPPAR